MLTQPDTPNRDGRSHSREIRVGIAGIGNCASAFVQGLACYAETSNKTAVPGLANAEIGPYRPRDIRIVSAFDIDAHKVGTELSSAILRAPNNTLRFCAPEPGGPIVARGPTLDGLAETVSPLVPESDLPPIDVAGELKRSETEVLVSFLPVGSRYATYHYANAALAAGAAYVNCIPVFLSTEPAWRARFEERGLPLIGDDIKSQVGATILHRTLARLFEQRGAVIDRMYQLNFGGNTDFLNMQEKERLTMKRISKTRAVTTQMRTALPPEHIHIGPSDYIPWLCDRKIAEIRIEGRIFGGAPVTLDAKLTVWDSPNSAGVVIDAVRAAKLALDRGLKGALTAPSAWLMKSPPVPMDESMAREQFMAFIKDDLPEGRHL